jgi:hypothetical protein
MSMGTATNRYSIGKSCHMMTSTSIRTACRTGITADASTVRPEGCHGYLSTRRLTSLEYASAFTVGNDLPTNPAKHYSVGNVLYSTILAQGAKNGNSV